MQDITWVTLYDIVVIDIDVSLCLKIEASFNDTNYVSSCGKKKSKEVFITSIIKK